MSFTAALICTWSLSKLVTKDRDYFSPHLTAPNGLRRVKFSQKNLRESLGLVVLQITHHGFRQHRSQNTTLHNVLTLRL